MNQSRTPLRRFVCRTAAATALACALRSLAVALFFDRKVGYLDPNVFSTLLYIIIALSIIGAAAYSFFVQRNEKKMPADTLPDVCAHSPLTRAASVLVAGVFLAAAAYELWGIEEGGLYSTFRLIAAIGAALYFASAHNQKLAYIGIASHFYCLFSLVTEYFDWTVPMNSPIKLMQQAAMLSVMLYMVAELNVRIGRTANHLRFTLFAALAALFGITNGGSLAVAAIVGGIVPTDYWVRSLPPLVIGLYALSRLHSIAIAPEIPRVQAAAPIDSNAPCDAEIDMTEETTDSSPEELPADPTPTAEPSTAPIDTPPQDTQTTTEEEQ